MDSNVHIAYLLFGGNLGPVEMNFQKAEHRLEQKVTVVEKSKIYRTEAWGMTDAPEFLNQVLQVKTALSPRGLLELCLETELALGRNRQNENKGQYKYQNRKLDIDILFYDDILLNETDLQIPHPRLQERKFVLVPLVEIAAEKIHPAMGQSIGQLLLNLEDELEVNPNE